MVCCARTSTHANQSNTTRSPTKTKAKTSTKTKTKARSRRRRHTTASQPTMDILRVAMRFRVETRRGGGAGAGAELRRFTALATRFRLLVRYTLDRSSDAAPLSSLLSSLNPTSKGCQTNGERAKPDRHGTNQTSKEQ